MDSTPSVQKDSNTVAALYASAELDREVYLVRAREAAELTVPSIMLPQGSTSTTEQHTPYQSVGSRGVKNLASKLLLALMPPNTPFFKLSIDEFVLEELGGSDEARGEFLEALRKMEDSVQTYLEQNQLRVTGLEILMNLIITGNVLLHVPQDGGSRMFPLDQYVVLRDPAGAVLRIIIKEVAGKDVLTVDQLKLLEDPVLKASSEDQKEEHRKTVDIYTSIQRTPQGGQMIFQELNGRIVPGSLGRFPKGKSAYIPLRFRKIDGEDYGRGFVEEMIGDLRSLEGLTMAMVEGGAAMSKVLFLVKPNGTTSKKTISDTDNLDVRDGDPDDVGVLKVDKLGDFRFVLELSQDIKERLSFAFLLNSSVRRNGERVTAEEIRFVASELEDTLGGIYSILSQELQIPLVNRVMHLLQKKGRLPILPKDTVSPEIVAGLEALGRTHDLAKLDTFLADIDPQDRRNFLHMDRVYALRAIAVGVPENILKDEDTIKQEQEQARAAALAERTAPNVVTQAGGILQQAQDGQPAGEQQTQ